MSDYKKPAKNIYIFDLDGTLADCTHRLHWIQGENKNREAFYEDCIDDKPIYPIVKILNGIAKDMSAKIIILTGRSDAVKDETLKWLHEHIVHFDQLRMRKANDWRPDHVIKQEWLSSYHDKDKIACVFEDRSRVVQMWRENGIQCLQVAEGNF